MLSRPWMTLIILKVKELETWLTSRLILKYTAPALPKTMAEMVGTGKETSPNRKMQGSVADVISYRTY